jgi:hypothetical protein
MTTHAASVKPIGYGKMGYGNPTSMGYERAIGHRTRLTPRSVVSQKHHDEECRHCHSPCGLGLVTFAELLKLLLQIESNTRSVERSETRSRE